MFDRYHYQGCDIYYNIIIFDGVTIMNMYFNLYFLNIKHNNKIFNDNIFKNEMTTVRCYSYNRIHDNKML